MTTTETDALQLLKERYATMSDLNGARSVLFWDQQTYMPEGGVAARAEQLATLSRMSHEMLVAAETGRLIDAAGEPEPETEEAAIVRLARRDYDKATKLPSRLVEETSRATALAEPAWARARSDSDWAAFAPHLEKIVTLRREAAEALGYEDHPYDALLDAYEPGAKKARLEETFEGLREEIVPMISRISELADEGDASLLRGEFD